MSVPDAILGQLRSAVDPVYDGHVPVDEQGRPLTQRYAAFWPDTGSRFADDLGHTSDRYVFRWQVTSVGASREQAEWVAVRCRDAVVDQRIAVEGWRTAPVDHVSSAPIRRDDDLPGEPIFYAVDTYSLTATR